MEYTFSKHVLERYVERMQDYDSAIDINVFIASRSDDIKSRIVKLIEYGTLIYSGKSTTEYNKKEVDVYLNRDGWAIIVDRNTNNVITLFSITLGLDKDFDREYLDKIIERLNQLKQEQQLILDDLMVQQELYDGLLLDNQSLENELRQQINNLEQQDKAYREVLETLNNSKAHADLEIRQFVGKLLGRKVF